jgi:hypothetical protein
MRTTVRRKRSVAAWLQRISIADPYIIKVASNQVEERGARDDLQDI